MRRNDRGSSSRSCLRPESVVVDCGRRKSTCGYCKSKAPTSISHGLWANSLTVYDYQDLLDRGWRRSGSFLYKPEMENTCCPSYTIRLRALDFVASKEQLRVSRRMQRYLNGKLEAKVSCRTLAEPNTCHGSCSSVYNGLNPTSDKLYGKHEGENEADNTLRYFAEKIDDAVSTFTTCGPLPSIDLPKASVKHVSTGKRKLHVEGCEELLYTCGISFQIAAAVRRAKSTEKQYGKGNTLQLKNEFSPSDIAEKLASSVRDILKDSGFSIRACNGHINIYAANKDVTSGVVRLNVPQLKNTATESEQKVPLKVVSEESQRKKRLEIRLKRSSFDPEEYALYKKYQTRVHNDAPEHVTASSYKRFLVDTPLVPVQPTTDDTVPTCGFGSFHQQYVVDGHLVAVGVVDILPKCLSSKYLFWDPDYASLSLGKYSALQEISWVKENQLFCPRLQYYYLGYYIHSCSKMRYKARYYPSELLCPLRYRWVPFQIAKPLLDRKAYVVLSDPAAIENGESSQLDNLENDVELQHDDLMEDDSNDVYLDGGGDGMSEANSDSSGDELTPETNDLAETSDISNILIGLKDSRLRFKDIRSAFDFKGRRRMESQLSRYKKVVGDELSERMVYSLG